jgi:tol-pal system protein YbgF
MKHKRINKPGLLITVFSIGLLATTMSMAQALTPDQLTLRVDETSRALDNIQKEIKRLGNQIDNRAMLDLFQRVDELADEINQLRGDLEVQSNDLSDLKKRQRELYLDTDRRLRDLENRALSQPSVVAPTQAPTPDTSTDLTPGTDSTGTSVIVPATGATQTAQPGTTASSEEKEAYQASFDTLKEGRYKKAKASFKSFLNQYPNSIYAGNAQYWLGEANYVTRNFEQGIIEFQQVVDRYPKSAKVPDAMLKLGYTFYELKQHEEAKAILQELRKRFPKSTAYRLAGKRLDRMRKEGL